MLPRAGAVTRARKPPRVTTAIRFDPAVLERLHVEADARDVSVNWLVNRAIEEFLPRLVPADRLLLTRDPAPTTPSPACVYCDLPAGHDGDHEP